MLRPLNLVDQLNRIARGLPSDWSEARFMLTVTDEAQAGRAAALLGPANPGRLGNKIRFSVTRGGAGIRLDGARRLLRRLVQEGVVARLELLGAEEAGPLEVRRREGLRSQWERALAALPSDWSDIYAEVRLESTDYLEPGAILLAPLNPSRHGEATAFRFRCAHNFGYGVAPEMASRCFERCDEEGITGEIEILHVLSDTHPVATQGPVWLVGGRTV